MGRMDHNGEDFHYVVGYKLADTADRMTEIKVRDYRQSEIIIPDQETFQKYEIFVRAANQKGSAPESSLDRKYAFSGEDGKYIGKLAVYL